MMKKSFRKWMSLALAAALSLSLAAPAMAVQDGATAAAGGNGDQYTQTDLFTHDMVTDNPGEVGYTSMYNEPGFMTQRGYNGMCFSLFEAAQYGLLWDTYDEEVNGVTLTEEQYEANPDDPAVQEQNNKKVFPFGSEERAWVETKRADIIRMYSAAKEGGQKTYFMQDIIVLPVKLRSDRAADILTNNQIDIRKAETQQLMDYMYEEMFTELVDEKGNPVVDGIYVRYGETYTGERWGVPYHTGNNPIMGDQVATHVLLMNYLRDEICEKLDKEIIYRTWGFGAFQENPTMYLQVSDQVEPHENFYIAIKHTAGDFHRTTPFNQCLNIGKHQQIVEVQAAREYEGKGAFPNYIGDGVINGFEEYEWSMSPDANKSLRDVINVENTLIKGIWTWSRGGGWAGPYISGPGYPNDNMDDPFHDREDGSIPVPNGSELWDDLNAYVVTQWAKDTSRTDEELALEYATEILGMDAEDAASFYDLCIKSARAVLLGRARDTDAYNVDFWWFRDEGINPTIFWKNIQSAYDNDAIDVMLAEKAECVQLWDEIVEIAEGLEETNQPLPDKAVTGSTTTVKEYIVMTAKYGRYLFEIVQQMHIAAAAKLVAEGEAEAAGTTPIYPQVMKDAVDEYERLWAEWKQFYEDNKDQGCPTLFAKTSNPFPGYNSLQHCSPYDSAMTSMRFSLTTTPVLQVNAGSTASISYAVSPYDMSAVTFRSSDESVATVNESGVVTGVKDGVARITASAGDGVLTAVTLVKVMDGAAEPTEVWSEDFSTDVSGAWSGGTWNEQGQYLNITGNPKNIYYNLPEQYTGSMTFTFDLRVDNITGRCFLVMRDAGGKTIAQLDIRGNQSSTGNIVMDQGNENFTIVVEGYEADKTYTVTVNLDTNAKTYTVQVGDKTYSLPFRDTSAANFGQIWVGTRSSVNLQLDNMSIRQAAQPEAPTAQEVAQTITELDPVDISDEKIPMPLLPEGYEIAIYSSSNEGVVAKDGTITPPAADTQVELVFQVTRTSDSTTANTAPIQVTVPKDISLDEVMASLAFPAPQLWDTQLAMPQLPEGFSLRILSSDKPEILSSSGAMTTPDADTTVNLTVRVIKEYGQGGSQEKTVPVVVPGCSAQDVADTFEDITVSYGDKFLTLPQVYAGFQVRITESAAPDVVALDGTLKPVGAQQVAVTLQVTRENSPVVGEKEIKVNIPAYTLETVYADDFSSQQAGSDMEGEYIPNRNPERVTVTVEKDGDNQAIKLVQSVTATSGSVLPTKAIEAVAGDVWFSGKVKVESSGGAYFIAYSSSGKKVAQFDFDRSGNNITLNVGSSAPVLYTPYYQDVWYTLAARCNFETREMDLYVNGTKVMETEISDASAENIGRVSLGMFSQSANTVWYDDIAVETVAEATAPTQYTVTFAAGEGSGSMEPVQVAENGSYTLPENKFVAPQGKQFKAWSVNGEEKAPGTSITVTGDITVTAIWETIPVKEYTVSFAASEGSGSMESVKVAENGSYTLPENKFVAPQGKQFKAWSVNGEEKAPGTSITVTGDITVTAIWETIPVKEYTVSFAAGEGSGSMESVKVAENGSYTLPENKFVAPQGKQFKAWSVNGEEKAPGTSITVTGDITVTAVWEDVPVNSYTVTFMSNGSAIATVAVEEGQPVAEPADPTLEGYTFGGWYTDEACTSAYNFSAPVTGDLTLYAQWIAVTPSREKYDISVSVEGGGTVTASARYSSEANPITLTVKANAGYVLDSLTVTDDQGDALNLTDRGNGKYTFQMPESKVTVEAVFVKDGTAPVEPTEPETSFQDVSKSAWYYDAVEYAVEKGFMAGVTKHTFAPDAQLTRAQLAQMLYALEGSPKVTSESAFTDVADSAWYADAVTWAVEHKLVSGYGDGTFGPDDALTREQLTAILYAYAKGEGADMDGKADLSKYTDIADLSAWAETSMAWAVDAGLIGGMEDGTLAPAGTATRAQMAQIMMNLLEKVL